MLNNNNPKELWAEINWNDKNSNTIIKTPTAEDLGRQFEKKSLISNEENFIPNPVITSVPVLDNPISLEDVEKASRRLKANRSTADGWVPGMITSISHSLFPILITLLNIILQMALFPEHWRTSIIAAIFKNKGSSLLPTNYRPISLVQMISKLFDFILLDRFKLWFKPHDCQSAYQNKRNCAEHVFLLRALVAQCKAVKSKLFIICIDFEGAFDKISRKRLLHKLQLFGAGSIFIACIATIYSLTDCIIYNKETNFSYHLVAGIKQGLPLSPWLFLFYINDMFDLFDSIYSKSMIHLLIHAVDTTIIAKSRREAENKVRTLISYCKNNYICLQLSKCNFICINGNKDDKKDITIDNGLIKNVDYVKLLGSQIGQLGNISHDLKLHMKSRFFAVNKFYNFIRSNKLAPINVKLKVMRACVISCLLHNCETFGSLIPDKLDSTYMKMIKACLNVRSYTPNKIALIESGMPSLKSMIQARQWNFYKSFFENLELHSTRKNVFENLITQNSAYIRHYIHLQNTYLSRKHLHAAHLIVLKDDINTLATNTKNYKFSIYKQFNPELSSPTHVLDKPWATSFVRLRVSSHSFPIETGRWHRINREDRLCPHCNVLGDEHHFIYDCLEIDRRNLTDIPQISDLINYDKLNTLLENLIEFL